MGGVGAATYRALSSGQEFVGELVRVGGEAAVSKELCKHPA